MLRLVHRLLTGALVVVLVVVLAGCGDTDPDDGGGAEGPDTADREAAAAGTLEPVPLTLAPVANLEYATASATRPGTGDLYVTEQAGRVRLLRPGTDGVLALDPEPVLDISEVIGPDEPGGEPGLLGIAFSPDGQHLYLSYTSNQGPDAGWLRQISEWQVLGDEVVAASRRPVLEFHKDYPQHNGGDIRFGPDGYLYAGFGDTAPVADAFSTGQDPDDLLGGIVRIDPSEPTDELGYGIPQDNPCASGRRDGQAGRPEVWLIGSRNPWRISFDRETGDLWVSDVGDQRREEITRLPAEDGEHAGRGANLGWSQMEGSSQYRGREEPADHVPPTFDYPHRTGGCSVIGGFVYRGEAIPALQGTYVYSDYCQPDLHGIRVADDGTVTEGLLGSTVPDSPVAFGEDVDGELYVLTATGVYAMLPASAGGPGVTATTSP